MRLMTNDVPSQTITAVQIVSQYGTDDITILDSVLSELFFVLEFQPMYKLPRNEIVGRFRGLIAATPQFKLLPATVDSFNLYANSPKLDYTDCLLATSADMRQANVLTFDKDLQKILT